MIRRTAALFLAVLCTVLCMASGCGARKEAREAKAAGQEYLEAGEYQKAAEEFRRAYDTAGRSGKKFRDDIRIWLGDAEFSGGNYTEAAAVYRSLTETEEKKPEYHYYLAASEAGTGDVSAALADYRAASGKDKKHNSFETPGCVTAFRMTEQALLDAGMVTEAADLCNEEFAAGAVHPEVYNRAGMCCMLSGDYEKAGEMFAKGLEAAAGSGEETETAVREICTRELMWNQAVLSERRGDYAGALAAFRAWRDRFGSEEDAEREILFLESRVEE